MGRLTADSFLERYSGIPQSSLRSPFAPAPSAMLIF